MSTVLHVLPHSDPIGQSHDLSWHVLRPQMTPVGQGDDPIWAKNDQIELLIKICKCLSFFHMFLGQIVSQCLHLLPHSDPIGQGHDPTSHILSIIP